MSGGAFDYAQYRIADIYTKIEDEIYGHFLDDEFNVNRYIEDHWLEDSEKEYVRKHHHTIPNRSEYSKETIKEFKKGIAILKKAEVYAQRIDWLLSGYNGEIEVRINPAKKDETRSNREFVLWSMEVDSIKKID